MEQGVETRAPAPIAPIEAQNAEKSSFLSRAKEIVAVGAIAGLALVAGVKSGQDTYEASGAPVYPGKISGTPDSHTHISAENRTVDDVYEEVGGKVYRGNRTIDVLKPSEISRGLYKGLFTDFGHTPTYRIPRLREVAHIDDRYLFEDEHRENPNQYPLRIYNTTQYPLDLRFIDYSVSATKLWLDQTLRQDDGEVIINGIERAQVKPVADPHTLIMSNIYPDTLDRSHYSKGTTRRYPGHAAVSFMVRHMPDAYDGPFKTGLPFSKRGIATEICQSMVKVENVRPFFASEGTIEAHREYWEKPPGQKGLDSVGQEEVCNSLGGIITAIYEGGQDELDRYKNWPQKNIDLTFSQHRDVSIADRQIPAFFAQKRCALQKENEIITTRNGRNLPTVAWYRQNEVD